MNCHDALLQFDAARPDGSDWNDPELHDARQHLDICPNCSLAVAQRHAWDLALLNTTANTSVTPPNGLASRLLEALDSHTSTETEATVANPEKGNHGSVRRRWVNVAVAVGLLAGIGLAWRSNLVTTKPLTVEQIRNWPDAQFETVDDFEALAALPEWIESQGGAPLPTGWDPLWLRRPARGWPDRDSVAVMAFRVPLTQRDSVSGLLLAVPIDEVAEAPVVNHVTTARPRYSKSGRFSTTSWTDTASGTVFICLVAPGQYERLRRALVPRPV